VAIVTTAQLKTLLPGYGGTADDTALAVEIGRAEAELSAVAGWPRADDGSQSFTTATYTVFVDAPEAGSSRMLPLPLPVVQSVTSAHASLVDTYDASSLVDSSDYTITPDGLWLLASAVGVWVKARRGNRVVLVAGWDQGDAPANLEAAVIAQAKYRWSILRTSQDVPQATIGGASVSKGPANTKSTAVGPMSISPVALSLLQSSPAYRWEASIG
jgi:hypothetical protein